MVQHNYIDWWYPYCRDSCRILKHGLYDLEVKSL